MPLPANYDELFDYGKVYNVTDGKYNYKNGGLEVALNGHDEDADGVWRTYTKNGTLGSKVGFLKWWQGNPRKMSEFYKVCS